VKLVRGAWKLLVGIKDALVLIAMLLFFGVLFGALAARPGGSTNRAGALLLKLDGPIVEQPNDPGTLASLSGSPTTTEYRLRDLVRALDKAKGDADVKVVVLDLDGFAGGYPAALTEVGDAIRRVRDSGKPVLSYATAYTDGAYRLAANASEVWVNPMGGSLFMGPGGSQLYYKGLIDKLGVTAHVYRVGKYKSYVEPYTRDAASPEAKEEVVKLYQVIFGQWQEAIAKARPKAKVGPFLTAPDKVRRRVISPRRTSTRVWSTSSAPGSTSPSASPRSPAPMPTRRPAISRRSPMTATSRAIRCRPAATRSAC
jgi:protease-4